MFNLTSAGDFDAFIFKLSEVVTGGSDNTSILHDLKEAYYSDARNRG